MVGLGRDLTAHGVPADYLLICVSLSLTGVPLSFSLASSHFSGNQICVVEYISPVAIPWFHLPFNQGTGISPSSGCDTWAGTSSTLPGCSEPQCPTYPGTIPGMEWPQRLLETCARACPASQGRTPSEKPLRIHSLEPGWVCSSPVLPALSSLVQGGRGCPGAAPAEAAAGLCCS